MNKKLFALSGILVSNIAVADANAPKKYEIALQSIKKDEQRKAEEQKKETYDTLPIEVAITFHKLTDGDAITLDDGDAITLDDGAIRKLECTDNDDVVYEVDSFRYPQKSLLLAKLDHYALVHGSRVYLAKFTVNGRINCIHPQIDVKTADFVGFRYTVRVSPELDAYIKEQVQK